MQSTVTLLRIFYNVYPIRGGNIERGLISDALLKYRPDSRVLLVGIALERARTR